MSTVMFKETLGELGTVRVDNVGTVSCLCSVHEEGPRRRWQNS